MYDDRTAPLSRERTTPLDTTRALMLYDLAAMYDAELHLAEVLPAMAAETAPGEVSDAFLSHAQETELHAENLRSCFEILGIPPTAVTNFGVRGLTQDHDAFVAQQPSREALIAFNLGAAAKTEHLEIASYIGLLRQAHTLELRDVALLLAANLRVEQLTASKVEQLADENSRSHVHASGLQAEEFRWSAYTDDARTMLSGEERDAAMKREDGLTPRVAVDLGGRDAPAPP